MDQSALSSAAAEPAGLVMIAHPDAGDVAYFLRQAASEYAPQLVTVEYRLAGQTSAVSFSALMPCQVLVISQAFYRQLRLYTFTNLRGTLGPAVIVLNEPGGSPTARDLVEAMNAGVQGWFVAPYWPQTAVKLLRRIQALLPAAAPSRLTSPQCESVSPCTN